MAYHDPLHRQQKPLSKFSVLITSYKSFWNGCPKGDRESGIGMCKIFLILRGVYGVQSTAAFGVHGLLVTPVAGIVATQ